MVDDLMIPDGEEPTEEQERAIYAAHCANLKLRPWQEPPCVLDEHENLRGTADEAQGMALLRRMLDAGVSRWHPDPLRALAEAEKATRKGRRNKETS